MTDSPLSPEEMAEARSIFRGIVEGVSACRFCAGIHARVAKLDEWFQPCPRIKRIEWYADGATMQAVEFWPNGEWESSVVFPDDVWGEDDE